MTADELVEIFRLTGMDARDARDVCLSAAERIEQKRKMNAEGRIHTERIYNALKIINGPTGVKP